MKGAFFGKMKKSLEMNMSCFLHCNIYISLLKQQLVRGLKFRNQEQMPHLKSKNMPKNSKSTS